MRLCQMNKQTPFQIELIALIATCYLVYVECQCTGTPQRLDSTSNTYQTLTSYNYPSNYENSQTCQYIIDSGNSNRKVAISYIAFNLETGYDYLRVYDSNSTKNLTAVDTGVGRKAYMSTGRYMFLRFTSDSSITWSGFKIQYLSILDTITPLSSVLTVDITTERQYSPTNLTDPIGTNFYTTKEWTIRTNNTAGQFSVKVVYTDGSDFISYGCSTVNQYGLSLLRGGALLYQICDFLQDAITVYGSGTQNITVRFRAPFINGIDRGFILITSYTGTSTPTSTVHVLTTPSLSRVCGTASAPTELTTASSTQYVASPSFPSHYSNNMDCWWVITSRTNGVKLRPEQVNMDTADVITVYDGPSSNYVVLRTYTGTITGSMDFLQSTGKSLTIHFSTDGSVTDTGFYFAYEDGVPAVPSCATYNYTSLTAGSTQLQLKSHAWYPSNYINFMDSYWLISKPSESDTLFGKFTSFRIELSSSCVYDYVKIYSGACEDITNRLVFICGEQDNYEFQHRYGKYVLIHFHTDVSVTFSGWVMTYYTNDTSTTAESTETAKDRVRYIIGGCLGVAALVLVVVVSCYCIRKKFSPRTAPDTHKMLQSKPPTNTSFKNKAHLYSVVIMASKPKVRPNFTKQKRQGQQLPYPTLSTGNERQGQQLPYPPLSTGIERQGQQLHVPYPPLSTGIERHGQHLPYSSQTTFNERGGSQFHTSPPPPYSNNTILDLTNEESYIPQIGQKSLNSPGSTDMSYDSKDIPPPFKYIMPYQLQ